MRQIEPWLFLAPSLIVILAVFGYPVIRLIQLSTQKTIEGVTRFTGLATFGTLLRDDIFLKAVTNSLYLLLCIPVMVFIALLLAILLFERVRGWQTYRSILFLPYLLPITVVGLVFAYFFELNGAFNDLLRAVGLDRLALEWLGNSRLALPTVMVVIIWKEVGFGMILFLARLMSVEEDLFDAARIDGAGWWQLQRYVTVPQLATVIEFFSVVSVITMLSWVFGYVYTMTFGGPANATIVTEFYIYQKAFRFNQMNLAAAASLLLLLVTWVFIFLELRLRNRSGLREVSG